MVVGGCRLFWDFLGVIVSCCEIFLVGSWWLKDVLGFLWVVVD